MRKFILSLMVLLIFTGCFTLKVSTDYDESFDFSKENSFAVIHNKINGEDNLNIDRIRNAIEADLKQKNYKKVSKEEADLIVIFHMDVKDKTEVQTSYMSMGYGRYRYGGGMSVPITNTYDYKEGTLVIETLNPKNEKIVWTATATAELKNQKTPQKRTEYINGIVQKMMEKFPK